VRDDHLVPNTPATDIILRNMVSVDPLPRTSSTKPYHWRLLGDDPPQRSIIVE